MTKLTSELKYELTLTSTSTLLWCGWGLLFILVQVGRHFHNCTQQQRLRTSSYGYPSNAFHGQRVNRRNRRSGGGWTRGGMVVCVAAVLDQQACQTDDGVVQFVGLGGYRHVVQ